MDGAEYSASEVAAQLAKAEDILAQLRASENPVELFDTLMNEYSEDSGLAGNPDGYLFSTKPDGVNFTSRMVTEFGEGTAALEYNEIGEIVESTFGYHIILRLDPMADETTVETYRAQWQGDQMDALFQERADAVEVETTAAYDELDAQVF